MRCYLCNSENLEKISDRTRDKENLPVLQCRDCRLIFLQNFDHISDEFYENSGMHAGKSDAAVEIHNLRQDSLADDNRRVALLSEKLARKSVVDFGSGWGGFITLMRERGITSAIKGIELESKYRKYMNEAEGCDIRKSIDDFDEKFDCITLFHCLEHLRNPAQMLRRLAESLKDNGEIVVEVPSGEDALISLYRNPAYLAFTLWSCHLYLFSPANINLLIAKAGLKLKHSFQVQRYPLENHLYWLSQGKPGGHKEWAPLSSPALRESYESALARLGKCDTLVFIAGKG